MTVAPLPVAPRPCPGEALSSWVRRIAARYGLEPHDLIRHILGQGAQMLGRVERLDNRADPELEHTLAEAASIDIARIQSQRIVSDDGAAWTWHRARPAWCNAFATICEATVKPTSARVGVWVAACSALRTG